jgi:hypothetical protein
MSLFVHVALLIIVIKIELVTVDTMTAARTYVKGCTLFFMKSDPGILGRPMTYLEGVNAVAPCLMFVADWSNWI